MKPMSLMLRKSHSHGRIGEAAVFAKCWMNGIPAYNTGGLRANFAGSDLIVETADPRQKLWIQVKTGAPSSKGQIYITQCAGEADLDHDKFAADFLVLVNIDAKTSAKHSHDGCLDFDSLTYYVLPRDDANALYRAAVTEWANRPKLDGGRRSLQNMAVHVAPEKMAYYKDAWHRLKTASESPDISELATHFE